MKFHVVRVVELSGISELTTQFPQRMLTYKECYHLATDGAKYWLGLVVRQMIYTFVFVLRSKSASPTSVPIFVALCNLIHVNGRQSGRVLRFLQFGW